jgi:hypothetical protein
VLRVHIAAEERAALAGQPFEMSLDDTADFMADFWGSQRSNVHHARGPRGEVGRVILLGLDVELRAQLHALAQHAV